MIFYCVYKYNCIPKHILVLSLVGILLSMTQFCVRLILAFLSSRGRISEVYKRRHVSTFFYVNRILLLVELPIYISAIHLKLISTSCKSEACDYIMVVFIIAVILIIINLISFISEFDSTGRAWRYTPKIWFKESKSALESLDRPNTQNLHTNLWNRRIRGLLCLQKCCMIKFKTKPKDHDYIKFFSDVLGHYLLTNLVKSDLMACLVMLRWQSKQWVGYGRRIPLGYILQNTAAVQNQCLDRLTVSPITSPTEKLSMDWLSIYRIWRYSKFCFSIYGRIPYIFESLLTGSNLCTLCRHINCNSSLCCCRSPSESDAYPAISHDYKIGCCLCTSKNCNLAVIKELCGIPLENIIHFSETNEIAILPYLVAIDDESQSIVIAIRGTLSIYDSIIDLIVGGKCIPCRFIPNDVAQRDAKQFIVHAGFYQSAINLRNEISALDLIEKARLKRPTYPVVVCGHSLGASVASVLGFLLLPVCPEIKVYAYGPALCTMTSLMGRYCKSFICSIIYGYDIVSRLSIRTTNDMKCRMLDALVNCNVPKYKLLGRSAARISFSYLLPCLNLSDLGVDSKLFDEKFKHRLLYPCVSSSRTSFDSFSENHSLNGSEHEVDRESIVNNDSPTPEYFHSLIETSRSSTFGRFCQGSRSLLHWVRSSGSPLLKISAYGLTYRNYMTASKSTINEQLDDSDSVNTNDTSSDCNFTNVVSMDTSVRFGGHTLHIVEVDVTASEEYPISSDQADIFGTDRPTIAVFTSSRQFQSVLVHPRMFLDHLPSNYNSALNRLYTASLNVDGNNFQASANGQLPHTTPVLRKWK